MRQRKAITVTELIDRIIDEAFEHCREAKVARRLLNEYGVGFRHLSTWLNESAESWTRQVNTMMLRNRLIKTNIGPEELEAQLAEEIGYSAESRHPGSVCSLASAGIERRQVCGQFWDACRRLLPPFSSNIQGVCARRSIIASAIVASPMMACHASMGTWPVMIVPVLL